MRSGPGRTGRAREGRTDTGIDLVAREAGSGDLVAIQVQVLRTHRDPCMAAGIDLHRDARPAGVRVRDDRLDCGCRVRERPLQHRAPREARAHLARRRLRGFRRRLGPIPHRSPDRARAAPREASLRAPGAGDHRCNRRLRRSRPWPNDHGLRDREDVHLAEARRAARRRGWVGAVHGALHQSAFAVGPGVGERRCGPSGDLRGLLRHPRRENAPATRT